MKEKNEVIFNKDELELQEHLKYLLSIVKNIMVNKRSY